MKQALLFCLIIFSTTAFSPGQSRQIGSPSKSDTNARSGGQSSSPSSINRNAMLISGEMGSEKAIINNNNNRDSSGAALSNNNNNVIRKGSIVNNNYNDDSGVGATFNNNNNNIIMKEGSIVNNNYNKIGGPTSKFNNNNNNKNFRGAVYNNNDNGVKMVKFGTHVKEEPSKNMENINSNDGVIGSYYNMDMDVPDGHGSHYMNKNMNNDGYGSVFNGNNLR